MQCASLEQQVRVVPANNRQRDGEASIRSPEEQASHLLASTLPAVARATAACSVRCECMIGRVIGLLRVPSSSSVSYTHLTLPTKRIV